MTDNAPKLRDIALKAQELYDTLHRLEKDLKALRGQHSALQNDLITLYTLKPREVKGGVDEAVS